MFVGVNDDDDDDDEFFPHQNHYSIRKNKRDFTYLTYFNFFPSFFFFFFFQESRIEGKVPHFFLSSAKDNNVFSLTKLFFLLLIL